MLEADVALAIDEIDRAGPVDDLGLLVEDLVDAPGRGLGPLAEHDQHPEQLERRLQHDDVSAEGEDRADLEVAVDHEPAAEQQHQGKSELREVLHRRA